MHAAEPNVPPTAGPIAQISAALRGLKVHDVSPLLENGMPAWAHHPPLEIRSDARTHDIHGYAAQTLVISEHTGAHVDAPFHIHPGTATIDEVPVDALLLRPYKKYDLTPLAAGPGELVGGEALRRAEREAGFELEPGDVAILEFGWDRWYAPADGRDPAWWGRNQPGLSEDACRYLADAGVAAVASDTPGCEVAHVEGEIRCGHGHDSHFLPNGILIVECLHGLASVPPVGLFLALPLKIKAGSGSPLRVVLLSE